MGSRFSHPAAALVLAFSLAIMLGRVLLSLPAASASGAGAPSMIALLTATSAVCVAVVGIKRRHPDFICAQADTLVEPGDFLIIAGPTSAIERFAARVS